MDEARKLGCYQYIDLQIFSHNHPAWTGEPSDSLLIHTESMFEIDQQTYRRRSQSGFPIGPLLAVASND
jgi:hypothetical protein